MVSASTLVLLLGISCSLCSCSCSSDGSRARPLRVLSVMTIPTKSHHLWMAPLTVRLAELGHHVESIDIQMPKNRPPNLNVTLMEPAVPFGDTTVMNMLRNGNAFQKLDAMYFFGLQSCNTSLSSPAVQRFMDPRYTGTFDVIIIDYPLHDCLFALFHRFGYPPGVVLSPFPTSFYMDALVATPLAPAAQPIVFAPYDLPMTFPQRVHTTLLYLYVYVKETFYHQPASDELIRRKLGPSFPGVMELRKSLAVAMVNEVPGIEQPRPYPPNVIPVGGMHVYPGNLSNIPKDLREWLDASEDGFIFMSFGSIMKPEFVPAEHRRAFIDTFAALGKKMRVLWKFEADDLVKELPANVRMMSWLPQNDILAHPKIKLFVSHCGGLSTQESIYLGVPMLGVPFIVDQHINADKIERLGMGLKLPFDKITKDTFTGKITELLHNAKYREATKRISSYMHDQKETPLERAVWWVEYAARSGGARHLRSAAAALDIPLPQYVLMDVIAFLVLSALLVVYLTVAVVRALVRFALCRWRAADKKHLKRD